MTTLTTNLTGLTAMQSAPPASGERARLAAAAKQFEAIFVRQMLASARKANFGDELFGSGAIDTFREMQDSQFADIAAQTGTLGLAQKIEAHLARFVDASASGKD